MDINDIITLTRAGFSKDEIIAMTSSGNNAQNQQTQTNGGQIEPKEEPKTETPKEEPKTETPKEEPKTSTQPALLNDAQFKELIQALNVGNASIDVPPTVTIDDKMKEHFTNLLLGKE